MHAISPNPLPNYVKGMDGQLRTGSPSGVTEPDSLGFMVSAFLIFEVVDLTLPSLYQDAGGIITASSCAHGGLMNWIL